MTTMFDVTDSVDKWHLSRWGRFTASQIGKLLTPGSGEMFGVGAWTYIRQKAMEKRTRMWERPELEFVKSLFHGKAYEEPAYEAYCRVTRNYSMQYCGTLNPIFLEYGPDAGGSPDGLMGEGDKIYCGLELKCPKDPAVHDLYLDMKDQFDLKARNKEYYAQMQFLMMITKSPEWHFASFDERFLNKREQLKIIEIKPDAKTQDNLEIRLLQAIKERNKIIELKQKQSSIAA